MHGQLKQRFLGGETETPVFYDILGMYIFQVYMVRHLYFLATCAPELCAYTARRSVVARLTVGPY